MEKLPIDELNNLRKEYAEGTRVKLLKIEDEQATEAGTMGTVIKVDDTGTIHVRWENGSGLGRVNDKDCGEDENSPSQKKILYAEMNYRTNVYEDFLSEFLRKDYSNVEDRDNIFDRIYSTSAKNIYDTLELKTELCTTSLQEECTIYANCVTFVIKSLWDAHEVDERYGAYSPSFKRFNNRFFETTFTKIKKVDNRLCEYLRKNIAAITPEEIEKRCMRPKIPCIIKSRDEGFNNYFAVIALKF